jgi:hypothetical protein
MATKKEEARRAALRRARHGRALRKFTPEEVAEKWKALPPVEQEKFEKVLRRLVTEPPQMKRKSR